MTTSDSRRSRRDGKLAALCGIAVAGLQLAPPAAAQVSSPEDQATARDLFNQARTLMKRGDFATACPKLEAASRLYPGSGVLLNLGDCYEHVGRTASAWTEFGEAVSAAERAGRADDLAEARRRQASLEPKLQRLTIRVGHPAQGLVVRRDGSELDRGVWGEAVPIDPGTHVVSADAPGRVAFSQSVSVLPSGKGAEVQVPDLAPLPAQPAPAVPESAPPPATPEAPGPHAAYWTGRRVASASLTGLGVVGLGVAGVLVIAAKSQDDKARGESGAARVSDSSAAVNTGNVATVVTCLGAGVAAAGLVLWLTAPSGPVVVGAAPDRVVLSGVF